MLLEKLVEQHRVHRLVTDRGDVALRVVGHQVGVHLRHLLGHEAELRDAQLVQLRLVMEGHRTQGQKSLTGSGHVGYVRFEPERGEKHAQLASVVHVTSASTRPNRLTGNSGDKCATLAVPDADCIGLAIDTKIVDVDIVRARDVEAGTSAQRRVVAPGSVEIECAISNGNVAAADVVARERAMAGGRVAVAGGITIKRESADRRVAGAGSIVKERQRTVGSVGAGRVA